MFFDISISLNPSHFSASLAMVISLFVTPNCSGVASQETVPHS
ncbi:hypothetical protein SEHO0A_00845 [Salmonella enterica subsp. houtenae str. ATCC BAA-1581]|nr:hypothetical protein SEHO0A_00845 [Salmonella enterica subsp. houtenae str. ATCC BAA-1581]